MQQKVLIVEDDAAQRKALVTHFTKAGFTAEGVPSGEAGLERIRTEKQDIVLLDLRLPGMSGIDVLETLRAQGIALPKIVILTNDDSMNAVSRTVDTGITDYLVKTDTSIHDVVQFVRDRLRE